MRPGRVELLLACCPNCGLPMRGVDGERPPLRIDEGAAWFHCLPCGQYRTYYATPADLRRGGGMQFK